MSEAAQAATPRADATQNSPQPAPAPAEASQTDAPAGAAQDLAVEVRQVELPEAADSASRGTGQIDILLEATVPVMVRLGQVEVQLKRLLQLGPGSVLQLDKQVGEPADLFLRGARFATGQLVVVGDRMAVRIKDILAPRP